MNERQAFAYQTPCESREELLAAATDSRREYLHTPDAIFSTLLTVDKMTYENETTINWHASVSVLNASLMPRATDSLDRGLRRRTVKILLRLLNGVGGEESTETVLRGRDGFHLFRALSFDEIAGLDAEFATTPAIDI